MEATRRWWAAGVLAGVLALGAVVLQRPLLLGGTAGLGGWLLARQARFAREAATVADGLAVEVTPLREFVVAGETLRVTATVSLEAPAPGRITVVVRPPVGTDDPPRAARTLSLAPGEREATTTFELSCPVAGRHDFREPSVTLADEEELLRSHPAVEDQPTVTVESRTPRNVHVGEAGERVAGAFGEHATGDRGPGLVAEDVRAYVPGDPADSIDWKATARLGEAHVREFEVEVDLETALVVDQRATMAEGRPGRTKLDYARAVALSYVAAAARDREAVGLYGVGDDGLTVRAPANTGGGHYEGLRLRLHDLAATGGDDWEPHATATPGGARRAAGLLDDDSAFARTLRPFFEDRERYVRRLESDPLYRTVRTELRSTAVETVTVLVTDDSHPAELRQAVDLARRGDDRVVVLLLPTVLFEQGGLADLDGAYDRYVAFEELRRELADRARVTAFEVAPSDRIEAVLAARTGRAEQ